MVEIPAKHLPEFVDSSSMDADTLRLAAQAHASARGAVDSFVVKPWLMLYLLDVWEAAQECADWHMAQGTRHVTDVNLWEAVTGRERRAEGGGS